MPRLDVAGWELELVSDRHDKFYRVFAVTAGQVVVQWGRRGATGQFALHRSAHPRGMAAEQVWAKQRRGYTLTHSAVLFSAQFAGPLMAPPARPVGEALAAAFTEAVLAEWADPLAALAAPGQLAAALLLERWSGQLATQPWAAALDAALEPFPRVFDPQRDVLLAAVPRNATGALVQAYRPAAAVICPLPAGSGPDLLEVALGLWSPGVQGPLADLSAALDAARLALA